MKRARQQNDQIDCKHVEGLEVEQTMLFLSDQAYFPTCRWFSIIKKQLPGKVCFLENR